MGSAPTGEAGQQGTRSSIQCGSNAERGPATFSLRALLCSGLRRSEQRPDLPNMCSHGPARQGGSAFGVTNEGGPLGGHRDTFPSLATLIGNFKHGVWTRENVEARRAVRAQIREIRALLRATQPGTK